jgi:hypothetical protein
MHANAEAISGSGADDFEQGSADTDPEADFKEKLDELGLRRVDAYVRDDREKKKVSKAAEEKRKYRAQRKAEGIGQFVVEVPEDDDAKQAVYAVAKAIVDDKANSKNVRSIILSIASSPALLDLVELLSEAEVDVSAITAMAQQGTLTRLADVCATHPALLDDVSRLAISNDRFLSVVDCLRHHAADISDGSANGLLQAAVAASDCPEALTLLELRRRGGLRARLLGWLLGKQ